MFNKLFTQCFEENDDSLIGKRVIVRSNEDAPLIIGKVVRYETFDGKAFKPLPIVVSEADKKEYICMGIVVEYSNELFNQLENMNPKEQWNFLRKRNA